MDPEVSWDSRGRLDHKDLRVFLDQEDHQEKTVAGAQVGIQEKKDHRVPQGSVSMPVPWSTGSKDPARDLVYRGMLQLRNGTP